MSDGRILEPDEAHELVSKAILDANKLIMKRVKVADSRQQWLLYGRIVNSLWASHYQPAFKKASEELFE